jgi:hypothetical protein
MVGCYGTNSFLVVEELTSNAPRSTSSLLPCLCILHNEKISTHWMLSVLDLPAQIRTTPFIFLHQNLSSYAPGASPP